jgi:hypothetical protein
MCNFKARNNKDIDIDNVDVEKDMDTSGPLRLVMMNNVLVVMLRWTRSANEQQERHGLKPLLHGDNIATYLS